MTRRQLLSKVVPAALISPKKALGYKRDIPEVKQGDTMTAEYVNAMVRAINER